MRHVTDAVGLAMAGLLLAGCSTTPAAPTPSYTSDPPEPALPYSTSAVDEAAYIAGMRTTPGTAGADDALLLTVGRGVCNGLSQASAQEVYVKVIEPAGLRGLAATAYAGEYLCPQYNDKVKQVADYFND